MIFTQSFNYLTEIWLVEVSSHSKSFKSQSIIKFKSNSGSDKAIRIWNINTTKNINTLMGHTDFVYSLAMLANGFLASGSGDTTIKIWNYSTGSLITTLYGHKGFYFRIFFLVYYLNQ